MTKQIDNTKYYLITYKYDGTQYRAMAPSKKTLVKILPQQYWSPEAWAIRKRGSWKYHHIWTIKEIDKKKYDKMNHIADELIWDQTYEDMYET